MKIERVHVHNYRSIIDAEVRVDDYLLLVGANNAGKSTFFNAIRLFYGQLKWDPKTDFPAKGAEDKNAWVEIDCRINEAENETLSTQYQKPERSLTLRKYLQVDEDAEEDVEQPEGTEKTESKKSKKTAGLIYAVKDGKVQSTAFYGTQNIAAGKLGELIYIPAVAKTGDLMKVTGPSPFRDIMDVVVGSRLIEHKAFADVAGAIDKLEAQASAAGGPFQTFTQEFNSRFSPQWGVSIDLKLKKPSAEDIIKTMLDPFFRDPSLEDRALDLEYYGQGMQRAAINELIEMLPEYQKIKEEEKKKEKAQAAARKAKAATATKSRARAKKDDAVFSADYTLILYEEPEAFLHPAKQMALAVKLRALGAQPNCQVIASSHSSEFASRNVSTLHHMARFEKCAAVCRVRQPEADRLQNELRCLSEKISDSLKVTKPYGTELQRQHRDEHFFTAWLDTERTAIFFANKVLLVEGATERVLFDYLLRSPWSNLLDQLGNFAVLECGGKYNVPRYMTLMREFGIPFGIMIDDDQKNGEKKKSEAPDQNGLNLFIESMSKDPDYLELRCAPPVLIHNNIEAFLGSPTEKGLSGEFKAYEIIAWLQNEDNAAQKNERIDALKVKFCEALGLPASIP